jgi:hypothetical protein
VARGGFFWFPHLALPGSGSLSGILTLLARFHSGSAALETFPD